MVLTRKHRDKDNVLSFKKKIGRKLGLLVSYSVLECTLKQHQLAQAQAKCVLMNLGAIYDFESFLV